MSATRPSETDNDLDRLVKLGLRLAEALERQARAAADIAEIHAASDPTDPFPLPPLPNYPADIGLTFSRIARAVRLTKALQARLARPPRNPAADPDMPDAARQAALNALSRRPPLQDPDGDRVEPPDDAERLDHEAWEHLEDEDIDARILARPVAEILAIIRRDLGLILPCEPDEVGRRRGEVAQRAGGGALIEPTPLAASAASAPPPAAFAGASPPSRRVGGGRPAADP